MTYARTSAGWFRPYFVDEDGILHMNEIANKYTNFYTRMTSGWVSRDALTQLSNAGDVRRVDRLVAANAIRKRLLSDPETNRSRIARFRVAYMLYLSNPSSDDPHASPYVIWRKCMKQENKNRRAQTRDLLEFNSLAAEDFDVPPSADLLQHLERHPHLIHNIALLKLQLKWPNEIYSNALVNGLRDAKKAMEAAAEARSVALEILS